MIILRDNTFLGGGVLSEKTFNSQAQKARRASWDMNQGKNSFIAANPKYNAKYDVNGAANSPIVAKRGTENAKFKIFQDKATQNKGAIQEELLVNGRSANRAGIPKSVANQTTRQNINQRIGNLSQEHQQQLAQSKAAREAAAKVTKQAEIISPKVKAANFVHGGVTNQTFKPNNTSFIGKMGKFIGNHKVATAVTGAAAVTGAGLLAYNHYKNK